jgi:MerR family transcriptional regulator, light-induced transcriptional regulator
MANASASRSGAGVNPKCADIPGCSSRRTTEVGVDLEAAAQKLGVHYQTAYRWVRTGILPAVKIGAGYRIETDAVDRLLAQQSRASSPVLEEERDWTAHRATLQAALRVGDEATALRFVNALQAGGVPALELCEVLISPILRQFGEAFEARTMTTADISVAAGICERLVGSLATPPRGRPRGLAVVASPEGEQHRLPGLMATACLRADRWRVHHLGADVPVGDLIKFAEVTDPDVVVLSVTVAHESGRATRDQLVAEHIKVLMGEPAAGLVRLIDDLGRLPK